MKHILEITVILNFLFCYFLMRRYFDNRRLQNAMESMLTQYQAEVIRGLKANGFKECGLIPTDQPGQSAALMLWEGQWWQDPRTAVVTSDGLVHNLPLWMYLERHETHIKSQKNPNANHIDK